MAMDLPQPLLDIRIRDLNLYRLREHQLVEKQTSIKEYTLLQGSSISILPMSMLLTQEMLLYIHILEVVISGKQIPLLINDNYLQVLLHQRQIDQYNSDYDKYHEY